MSQAPGFIWCYGWVRVEAPGFTRCYGWVRVEAPGFTRCYAWVWVEANGFSWCYGWVRVESPGFTRCYGWVRVAHLLSFLFRVVCFVCLFFRVFRLRPLSWVSIVDIFLIAVSVCLTTASFYNSYYLLICRKLSNWFLNDLTLIDLLHQQQDSIFGV
jgi:hypothetical protein